MSAVFIFKSFTTGRVSRCGLDNRAMIPARTLFRKDL